MAQTIKRNFFYNLLLQVSKVLFPLVTAPYIARVLDPEGVLIIRRFLPPYFVGLQQIN